MQLYISNKAESNKESISLFELTNGTKHNNNDFETEHTPAECKEIEKDDEGAHCICERIVPFMSKRLTRGSVPTVKI